MGFSRKGLVLDERYTVKYSVKVVVKAKQNSKVKTKPKTRLQGMFSLFYHRQPTKSYNFTLKL